MRRFGPSASRQPDAEAGAPREPVALASACRPTLATAKPTVHDGRTSGTPGRSIVTRGLSGHLQALPSTLRASRS
jgi:hypothetical protein